MAYKYRVEKKKGKLHTLDVTQCGEWLRYLHGCFTLYTYATWDTVTS